MTEWYFLEKNVWDQTPLGQMRKARGERESVCVCVAVFIK